MEINLFFNLILIPLKHYKNVYVLHNIYITANTIISLNVGVHRFHVAHFKPLFSVNGVIDQYWHYCQLFILKYLQFAALLEHYDVSKCEIIYQCV